jgi:hypothetical protein
MEDNDCRTDETNKVFHQSFHFLSYVVIIFQLLCIPLIHHNCIYIDVFSSTETQDNIHHEIPILIPEQDCCKLNANYADAANDESDDKNEFTDDEDGFVMMTPAAMLSQKIATESIGT